MALKRTDETIISGNFLHKVFGIIVLGMVLHSLHYIFRCIISSMNLKIARDFSSGLRPLRAKHK